jgi:putative chitinase
MISAAAIVKIAPAAQPYAVELVKQAAEAGIMANRNRASKFCGQIHHESMGFSRVVENLNYSADGLANTWPSRYAERAPGGGYVKITVSGRSRNKPNALAMVLARNPQAIANNAYANRMGNGPESSGEGWLYRGRGCKMITGKENYGKFSRGWLGDLSLLTNPDRVAEPDGAVASAIWFWSTSGLNEIADTGSDEAVTQRINGGQIGIDDRKRWTREYAAAWQEKPDFSNVVSSVTSTERPL